MLLTKIKLEIQSGNNVNIKKKKRLVRIYSIVDSNDIDNIKEKLKQEIQSTVLSPKCGITRKWEQFYEELC